MGKKNHYLKQKSSIIAKKYFGQHFLINDNVLSRIAAFAQNQMNVFEIGPGTGNLTECLFHHCQNLVCIEKDVDMLTRLQKRFAGKVKVIPGDIMEFSEDSIYQQFNDTKYLSIFGNLPYAIATHIMTSLCEWTHKPNQCVFLIQKEVAERIVANPGSKKYGSLSIYMQYHVDCEIIQYVDAASFDPPPKVDSAVIRWTYKEKPPIELENETHFFKFVKNGFMERRKMLKNGLTSRNPKNYTTSQLENLLESLGLSIKCRPEELSMFDFYKLYKALYE